MRRTRELRQRRQALLALGVFLFAGVWTFLHDVAVQHAICPEHGEVVDVADAPGEPEHHDHGPSFAPAAEDARARTHEHCPAVVFALERSLHPETLPFFRTSASSRHQALPRPVRASWEAFARFLLAPNHSPPSVV